MQTTDTIVDLLTRTRNANAAEHDFVEIPRGNMKESIIRTLTEGGHVKDYTVIEDSKQGILKVNLKYGGGEASVIRDLRGVLKPGLHTYSNVEDLPRVLKDLGITVISTSKSAMTDRQARKEGVGDEVLAFIW